MRKIILSLIASVVVALTAVPMTVATATSAEAAAYNSPCATRAEFNRIRVGMAVPTTQQIIGSRGKITMAGSFMSQRQWRVCPGGGAYWVTLTYLNGRLDNKIML